MAGCEKCNGAGWYKYDDIHSTICEDCCKHDEGWWELTDHYAGYEEGRDNFCCKKGCGMMRRDIKVVQCH